MARQRIVPFLDYEDAAAAIEWLVRSSDGRALAAGAAILGEPEEPGIGFRIGAPGDPEGRRMVGQGVG